MTAPSAARVFLPDIRAVERQMTLPLPERVRILRELEFDLEELRDRLVAQGLSADDARTRALDALVPDPEALRELGRLHAPWYLRATRSLGERRLWLFERTALVLATTSVLVVGTVVLLGADLLGDPSPFLWPVMGLGAVLFAAVVAKAFQLWIKRDHRRPHRGLASIPTLSGVIMGTGITGTLVDLYRLATILERAPEQAAALVSDWLARDAALLSVSMLLALAGALTWFILAQWLAVVSEAHREVLGLRQNLHREREN
jgi:hypothetical protein